MPNLVNALGPDYFNDYLRNAMFIHDEQVLRVRGVESRDNVMCFNIDTNTEVVLSYEDFQGWGKFSYPVLGYRKLGEHRAGYITKRQSTNRGLRLDNTFIDQSPMTRVLSDYSIIPPFRDERERSLAIMRPQFDSIKSLPKLLTGEIGHLVLSESLLIEPAVQNARVGGDWFTIYYKRVPIGTVSQDGTFSWTNNKYRALVPGGDN